MSRNSVPTTNKLSLLLFSAGISVFSISASTCAQTLPTPTQEFQQIHSISGDRQVEKSSQLASPIRTLPPIVSAARTPMAVMKATNWPSTRDARQAIPHDSELSASPRHTLPPIVSVARTPMELMKETNWLPTRDIDQLDDQLQAAKDEELNSNALVLQLIEKSFPAEMIAASEDAAVEETKAQVSSYVEAVETKSVLIDENIAEQTELVEPPAYDLEMLRPVAPVAVFVDGPDALRVNQVADYEIAVANGTSQATSVSSIRMQIPASAEILVVEREATINDLDRTLTWSVPTLAAGEQERIRFRLRFAGACEADFPVTVDQTGLEPQTISQQTVVR